MSTTNNESFPHSPPPSQPTHIRLTRKLHFDATVNHIAVLDRKLRSGELGATPVERLANAVGYLNLNASMLDANLARFVTVNPAMLRLKSIVRMIYPRPEPVLILGPTGVGKELIAKCFTKPSEILENGRLSESPFMAENCAALPENLLESILFGHVKGAFTGAHADHIGLLRAAQDGIVFLDEIGDLSPNLQAKFLRAIQEGVVRPVGSVDTHEIHCRFISATKRNLEELVDRGTFREDLFARLMTYSLTITGLKERPEDIEAITKKYLACPDDWATIHKFGPRELEFIYKYNVRGIEAILARHRATGQYWFDQQVIEEGTTL